MMNWRTLAFGAAIAVATAVITTQVVSQDRPADDEMERMMARWTQLAAPGEHHERLNVMIGTWNQTYEWWQQPGTEPSVNRGTATYKWIFGNRFVKGTYTGDFMGTSFEGMDLLGYDNFRKEYVSVWLDNMSTAMMMTRGKYKSDMNAIEMTGKHDDLMTGERDKPFRHVTKFIDDDNVVYEMYTHDANGKEFMAMRVKSVRKN